MQHLQSGATLQSGKYRIEKVLGQGGFGITYQAVQSGLEREVAVKEFFMKELCERDEATSHVTLGTSGSAETVGRFREKFLKEARNIARLDHPNIVSVIDVFEENGTAYYVMKYAANGSLADKVKREGYLPEPVATRYVLQIADALDYIHQQKMNHLDVKPANIMLSEKDEAVLIDFGLSKQYDATTGNQTSTTPVGISEGYAPMEQYMQGGVGAFSPETDIYSLGATFYKLLTGVTPPNASFVNNEGLPLDELRARGVSQKAIDVICKAMEPRKKYRMKDGRSFIDGLSNNAASSPSETFATIDDEATMLTPAMQRVEGERKRQEASVQAVQEKMGTASSASEDAAWEKAAVESREWAARRQSETNESSTRLNGQQPSDSENNNFWIVLVVIAIVIIIVIVSAVSHASRSSGALADSIVCDSTVVEEPYWDDEYLCDTISADEYLCDTISAEW